MLSVTSSFQVLYHVNDCIVRAAWKVANMATMKLSPFLTPEGDGINYRQSEENHQLPSGSAKQADVLSSTIRQSEQKLYQNTRVGQASIYKYRHRSHGVALSSLLISTAVVGEGEGRSGRSLAKLPLDPLFVQLRLHE